MSLVNSSYFIGERIIPNINQPDVALPLTKLIQLREPEYLKAALGYELFILFVAGIQVSSPNQRYIDILLGSDFRGFDGTLKKWTGFTSVSDSQSSILISSSAILDLFFTVGVTAGAPVNGDVSYVNSAIAGKKYSVTQRGFGPLEELKSDNSNIVTADIVINSIGGFTWLKGILFSNNDKYQIIFSEVSSTQISLNVSSAATTPVPVSPIADYVYFWWLKHHHSQVAGIGTVQGETANSRQVSSKHQACESWNSMSEKTSLLYEFLRMNEVIYPEFSKYYTARELRYLLTKINIFF